ncbi:MAG: caspase family protein [Spirochaetia bacterium]|nr:caspase family protein [Spirochaetia bacterium]
MKRFIVTFFLVTASILLFTSCDLFHTRNTVRGNSYALIYGVADYIGSVNDLTYTYNDAFDMNEFLTQQNFTTTARYNSDATKTAMLADMENLKNNPDVDENTITVFFFAGHGDGYFRTSPLSSELDDPTFLYPPAEYDGQASLIPYFTVGLSSEIFYASELLDKLAEIPGKKLLLLDICFAGGFAMNNGVDVDGLPDDYGFTGDPLNFFQTWEKYLSEKYDPKYKDIWVIGSAGENELAYEDSSVKNGYYTYYLLKSLGYNHDDLTISEMIPADHNADNLITVSEIYNYTFSSFEQFYNNSSKPLYAKYYSHISGGARDLILLDITH